MKLLSKPLTILSIFIYASIDVLASNYNNLDKDPETRSAIVREIYTDPSVILAAQQMTKDVSETLEKNNITYFAVYGTLLGAHRQKGENGDQPGGMIPWDDDADLCVFASDMGTLRDRPFRKIWDDLGFRIIKHPEVGLQVQEKTQRVNPKTGQPYTLFVDLFLVKPNADGTRYLLHPEEVQKKWPKGWLMKEQVEQLVRIPFGQFSLWSISNAEEYLSRLYGADWKTTGYHYFSHHSKVNGKMKWTLTGTDLNPAQPTGPLKNRVQGMPKPRKPSIPVVNRRESLSNFNGAFWNRFYSAGGLAREPSSFCQYILDKGMLSEGTTLLDVGCGNGRDTFEFRKKGIHAYGLDSSQEATASNLLCARKEGMAEDFFRTVDVCSADAMAEFQNFEAVYARFFIHAINEAQEAGFMTFLSRLLPGTRLFLEFRTERDPMLEMSTKVAPNKGKTDHYRRFINFGAFEKKIFDLGFKINESIEADNLSVATKVDPVKGQIVDNPMLGRIIATKR